MKESEAEKMLLHKKYHQWTREHIDKNTEQVELSGKTIRESIDKLNETVGKISGMMDKLLQVAEGLVNGFKDYNERMGNLLNKLNQRNGSEQLPK